MSLDQQLRSALQECADQCDPGTPEFVALLSGARARRRTTRRRRVGGVGAVVAVVLSSSALVAAQERWQILSRHEGAPADTPVEVDSRPSNIPWCVPREHPNRDRTWDLIRGAGDDIITPCAIFRDGMTIEENVALGRPYLWSHGGTTILARIDGVYHVTDGRLERLDGSHGEVVHFSPDGRYAAWIASDIHVHVADIKGSGEVRSAKMPFTQDWWLHRVGVDDTGRAYVMAVDDGSQEWTSQAWTYDPLSDAVTEVHGVPDAAETHNPISYVTPDGFAVLTRNLRGGSGEPTAVSVEGVVSADGQFEASRTVPIGRAAFSPDRSQLVQWTADGWWAQPADNLDSFVVLRGVPRDSYIGGGVQWEDARSVLISVQGNGEMDTYRCDSGTGDCALVSTAGDPAYGANAEPGG